MKMQQLKQDREYNFPYHYIPNFRGDFTNLVEWNWSKNYISAIEFILKEIKKDSINIESIFDIGCGDGRLTRELNIEFPNVNILGVDYSLKAISLAKAMNPNIKFLNSDITGQDFNYKCDAITLIEVFEHIPLDTCTDFVKALSDMLNKDGIVYLTVPSSNIAVSYKHFQHFSSELLEKYFQDYFDIENIEYIQRNSFMLKIVQKLTYNNLFIVNNRKINNFIYKLYKKYYFFTTDLKAERIYLKLRKKDI